MAKFLTTKAISSGIEDIIIKAKEKIVFITPYLYINPITIERIKEIEFDIEIILVYGKEELNEWEKQKIFGLSNLTIYYYHNLHAKCYFNEQQVIISSMNLHKYSETNNREMGVEADKINDKEIYDDAIAEANSIIKAATLIKEAKKKEEKKQSYYPHPLNFENVGNIEKWNEKLLEMLAEQHPNSKFELNKTSSTINCYGFESENLRLSIETGSENIRIVFQFSGIQQGEIYSEILKQNEDKINTIYPKNVVGWGSYMKRLTLDFMKREFPILLEYNKETLLQIYEYIKMGDEVIIKTLKGKGYYVTPEKKDGPNYEIVDKESMAEYYRLRDQEVIDRKIERMKIFNEAFPDAKFIFENNGVIAHNYPYKNISIDITGNLSIEFPKGIEKIKQHLLIVQLEKCFPTYRFYGSPYRINIYLEAKRISNGNEDSEYIEVLKKAIDLIKEKEHA